MATARPRPPGGQRYGQRRRSGARPGAGQAGGAHQLSICPATSSTARSWLGIGPVLPRERRLPLGPVGARLPPAHAWAAPPRADVHTPTPSTLWPVASARAWTIAGKVTVL